MIKNLQSQKGLLFGVSNVTEPAKKSCNHNDYRTFSFSAYQKHCGFFRDFSVKKANKQKSAPK